VPGGFFFPLKFEIFPKNLENSSFCQIFTLEKKRKEKVVPRSSRLLCLPKFTQRILLPRVGGGVVGGPGAAKFDDRSSGAITILL
jgi:hypothetical protein